MERTTMARSESKTVLGTARWAAGRLRRAVTRRFFGTPVTTSGPVAFVASPWSDAGFVYRRIVGLRPEVVLDVGANEGQFVESLREAGFAGRVISFEPQRKVFEVLRRKALQQDGWECHRLALGDADAVLPLHVSEFSLSSSLFPIGRLHIELMPQTGEAGIEEVPVVRLDTWSGAASFEGRRLFLKLDVQGFELPVIHGLGGLVRFIDGALVELDFATLFEGQSKYYDVMSALESVGLRFVGLSGAYVHPSTAEILWADGFFQRDNQQG
jgi:FkbM family methyltransferase